MFSLTNDTPKPAPRKFDSLQASQRKLFSGMHCPPGTRDLFAGLDDQSGGPDEGPADAGPDMPPKSIGGAYSAHWQKRLLSRFPTLDRICPPNLSTVNTGSDTRTPRKDHTRRN